MKTLPVKVKFGLYAGQVRRFPEHVARNLVGKGKAAWTDSGEERREHETATSEAPENAEMTRAQRRRRSA